MNKRDIERNNLLVIRSKLGRKDMSEEKNEAPLGIFRQRRTDEHASVIRDLITSDKNNPIKARIPGIFPMVYFRSLTFWASPGETIDYVIGDKQVHRPKTVAGLGEAMYDSYNIISQAYKGLAREEYERAASSWLAQSQALQQGTQQMRMEEGAKKAP